MEYNAEERWSYLMTSKLWNKLMGNVKNSGSRHSQTEAGAERAKTLHETMETKSPVYEVTISINDLKRRWVEQDGRCHWTGMQMSLDELKVKFSPFAVSVDRIDNNKDYHLENIVLTTRFGNLGRGAYAHSDFGEKLDKLLTERNQTRVELSDMEQISISTSHKPMDDLFY